MILLITPGQNGQSYAEYILKECFTPIWIY